MGCFLFLFSLSEWIFIGFVKRVLEGGLERNKKKEGKVVKEILHGVEKHEIESWGGGGVGRERE